MRVHAGPDMSVCVHTFDAVHLWSVTRSVFPSATASARSAGVSPESYISSALSVVFLRGSGSGVSRI